MLLFKYDHTTMRKMGIKAKIEDLYKKFGYFRVNTFQLSLKMG